MSDSSSETLFIVSAFLVSDSSSLRSSCSSMLVALLSSIAFFFRSFRRW